MNSKVMQWVAGFLFMVTSYTAQGSQYQLLLESNADAAAGNEIFLATFGSFADLLSANLSGASFSQLDINPNFSVGGFSFEPDSTTPVPEPGTIALLCLGFAGLSFSRRKQ